MGNSRVLIGFAAQVSKVGVGDAPQIGGIAILVAVISMVRLGSPEENYTIATLLKDGWNTGEEATRWRIYHAINSYTVFTTSYPFTKPFSALKEPELNLTMKAEDPGSSCDCQ